MNPYILNIPGIDPRLERVLRDMVEREDALSRELELVRKALDPLQMMARKENPIEGIITIPPRNDGGQDGQIRASKDGVIVSYVNPAEGIFPYLDLSIAGNITTGLDQLHAFTLPAGTLAKDGDMLWVRYGGTFATNDNDKRIQTEFDGTATANSGLFDQDSGNWMYDFLYTRTGPTTVKYPLIVHWGIGSRDGAGTSAGNYFFQGGFGGFSVANLNSTNVVLRLMAEGTATDDIQQGFSFIDVIKPRTVKFV